MPDYKVGSIVNGHVWTGADWVPVTQDAAPNRPVEGVSQRRGRWFRPKYVLGGWLAFAAVILLLGFIPNNVIQLLVSIAWIAAIAIALPATLLALILWLAGVGAQQTASDGES